MQFSIVYLATCLPDYFQGFSGHVYAVPLGTKPRKGEVRESLIKAIHTEELFDPRGESVAEQVYEDLCLSVIECFMGEDMRTRWSPSRDDLSECYAYFGVLVKEETKCA